MQKTKDQTTRTPLQPGSTHVVRRVNSYFPTSGTRRVAPSMYNNDLDNVLTRKPKIYSLLFRLVFGMLIQSCNLKSVLGN